MSKVTSQDILNLISAYEKLINNRNIGRGYEIRDMYWKDVLEALGLATNQYIKEIENDE